MAKATKRGRGRPPSINANERIALRCSKELQKRLDKWRGSQPDKPARSEAGRRLIEKALAADGF